LKKYVVKVKQKFGNYRTVIENYFFMTVLQVLNSFFYILIYPFLIRTLGMEGYGLYVYVFSIVTYFMAFVNFGFDFPGVKAVSQSRNDDTVKSKVVSCILTAKFYLLAVAIGGLAILLLFVEPFRERALLFIVVFLQTLGCVLFPTYFFQAMQKMRWVTFINVLFKVISLPFIFWLVASPADVWKYALIVSLTTLGGSLLALFLLVKIEKVCLRWYPWNILKGYYHDALPFFWSTSTTIVKQQSVNIIIGAFFGMGEVALYDLANKIIQLPQLLTASINGALFPRIINELNVQKVKRIVLYELGIGLLIIVGIVVVGKWLVLFLGGVQMLDAYPLAVVLSVTVVTWLIVGCYISFVFVPLHRYYLVTKNQIVAFLSFFIFCGIGLWFLGNIRAMAWAFALSGICEVVYCYVMVRKYKLLIPELFETRA